MISRIFVLFFAMAMALTSLSPSFAETKRTPAPSSTPVNPLDIGPINHDSLMFKNADQINLLNVLAASEMSQWPTLMKNNRSILNKEFMQILGMRGIDAYNRAVAVSKTNSMAARRYMDIAFRYMLLADMTALQLGLPDTYRLSLARKFEDAHVYDMALAISANVILMEKRNKDAHLLSGQVRMKMNDFFGALQDYQEVVKIEPNNDMAWANIGAIYLLLSNLPKAKDALKKAVAINGHNKEAKSMLDKVENPTQIPPPGDVNVTGPATEATTADAMAGQGEVSLQAGRLQEAEDTFRRSLQLSPTCWRAHMGLADLYFRKSEFYKSVDEYDLASKFAPSNAEPLRYMALACEKIFDQTGSGQYLDRAVDCLHRAISIKPDYAAARADQERVLSKKTNQVVKP